MTTDKIKLATSAATLVAGLGVSKVTKDIIKTNTVVDSPQDQIKVLVGSIVIGSMVASVAKEHVETTIKEARENIAKIKIKIAAAKEKPETE